MMRRDDVDGDDRDDDNDDHDKMTMTMTTTAVLDPTLILCMTRIASTGNVRNASTIEST